MWGFLRFILITLIIFPSDIFCHISAAPTPYDALSIQTPSHPPPIYDEFFTFRWTGNRPNFTLQLFDFNATLCRTFSNISDNSFTWDPVNIPGGTGAYLVLTDALSNSTYSSNFTIQGGAGQGKNSVAPGGESTSVNAGPSSSASASPLGTLPTSNRPTATAAGPVPSDSASPPVSEDASPHGSSPPSLSTRAIVGISLVALAVVAGAIASLFVWYRRERGQYFSPICPRWTSRATAATKRKVSALSRWKSLPPTPFRRSGDSWSTQSSEPSLSDKPVAWNPGLFARDMSVGSACPSPLPLAHQESPGRPRSPEGSVNATLLSLANTDLSVAASRGDPFRTITRSSVQRPQTPLSMVSSTNEPEVH